MTKAIQQLRRHVLLSVGGEFDFSYLTDRNSRKVDKKGVGTEDSRASRLQIARS